MIIADSGVHGCMYVHQKVLSMCNGSSDLLENESCSSILQDSNNSM